MVRDSSLFALGTTSGYKLFAFPPGRKEGVPVSNWVSLPLIYQGFCDDLLLTYITIAPSLLGLSQQHTNIFQCLQALKHPTLTPGATPFLCFSSRHKLEMLSCAFSKSRSACLAPEFPVFPQHTPPGELAPAFC